MALQRHRFGRRSEQLDPDQLALGLEDLEHVAAAEAQEERAAAPAQSRPARQRKINRGFLPDHLPRVDVVIDVEDRRCPCCAGALHPIGEDVAERLDVIPLQFRVLVVHRPKYACRTCSGTVVQAPAPPRLVEGGLPTEALVAHVIVAKYADHLPLYRQAQIYARQGIDLDRSTLRGLESDVSRLVAAAAACEDSERTTRIVQVVRRRDDGPRARSWPGSDEDRSTLGLCSRRSTLGRTGRRRAVAYVYAPDRKAERPIAHLEGFSGIAGRSMAMPVIAPSPRGATYDWHSVGLTFAAASMRLPPPADRDGGSCAYRRALRP